MSKKILEIIAKQLNKDVGDLGVREVYDYLQEVKEVDNVPAYEHRHYDAYTSTVEIIEGVFASYKYFSFNHDCSEIEEVVMCLDGLEICEVKPVQKTVTVYEPVEVKE